MRTLLLLSLFLAGCLDSATTTDEAEAGGPSQLVTLRALYEAECSMYATCATLQGDHFAGHVAACVEGGIESRCALFDCDAPLDAAVQAEAERCAAAYDVIADEAREDANYLHCGISSFPRGCAFILPRH